MPEPPNEQRNRDSLWDSAFSTYYHSYYQELTAAALLQRWERVDEVAKILVALTASGSAVAGFTLWQTEEFKVLWSTIAGLVAVVSIIHSVMNVSNRLSSLGDVKRIFATLRIELETFRHEMSIQPDFPVDTFNARFFEFRQRYQKAFILVKNDTLRTNKLSNNVQDALNKAIQSEYVNDQQRGN